MNATTQRIKVYAYDECLLIFDTNIYTHKYSKRRSECVWAKERKKERDKEIRTIVEDK